MDYLKSIDELYSALEPLGSTELPRTCGLLGSYSRREDHTEFPDLNV
jgi:hypothetical protein